MNARARGREAAAALLRFLLSTKFEFDLPLKPGTATAPHTESEYEFDRWAAATDNSSAESPLTPSFFSRDPAARHRGTALRSLEKFRGVVFFFYAPSVAKAFTTKEFELHTSNLKPLQLQLCPKLHSSKKCRLLLVNYY